jgi:hypothetical protein
MVAGFGLVVLFGLARYGRQPVVPCLGRQPGTKLSKARPGDKLCPTGSGPVRPCLARAHAVPCQAAHLVIYN